jgi:hypothetical protein
MPPQSDQEISCPNEVLVFESTKNFSKKKKKFFLEIPKIQFYFLRDGDLRFSSSLFRVAELQIQPLRALIQITVVIKRFFSVLISFDEFLTFLVLLKNAAESAVSERMNGFKVGGEDLVLE